MCLLAITGRRWCGRNRVEKFHPPSSCLNCSTSSGLSCLSLRASNWENWLQLLDLIGVALPKSDDFHLEEFANPNDILA